MHLSGRAVLGATLLLVMALLAACTPQEPAAPTISTIATPAPLLKDPVAVGSAACTPCHADIAKRHDATNHARTLYPAKRSALKELTPLEGEMRPGMTFRRKGDSLLVETANQIDGKKRQIPLALALGSGKTGMTFLIDEGDFTAEVSKSYFPHQKIWHTTPSQEGLNDSQIGAPHTEQATRNCLSCHAVTEPEQPMIPDRKFFGVGCESCHGRGSTHVESRAKIASLKNLRGDEMNTLCGRCHRTADDVKAMGPIAKDNTNRFQPYAMTLSKCFVKSQGKFTCITCHDPHENASKDIPTYEKTCLSCHDGSAQTKPLCPVKPKTGCVKCHMPTRSVFPDGADGPDLPVAMADHFIRIFKNKR